jgi:hypothetical protein
MQREINIPLPGGEQRAGMNLLETRCIRFVPD